ncbi:MAG: acetate kinase [Candidatus Cloacimonetes bacterium]|nr:acetate kinase [Candidatus Cloacimonadota bacterium]
MPASQNILIINCGSSSLKYEVYRMPGQESLGKGIVERIGEEQGIINQRSKDGALHYELPIPDHAAAMAQMSKALLDPEKGMIDDLSQIAAVGHRVVHGGEKYASSVIIDDDVIAAIEENIELAPLHNPANLTGIREAQKLLPGVPQTAVFDTAFHQAMPASAYLYGLPREMYEKHRIRRYGFHGTSHRYVAARAMTLMKRSPENTNVISCHLGNGASVTAIENGVSVDTSMGFTPLEGVMMGTRCGDIDPSIIFYLLERGYTEKDLYRILNKKSGLLGLSGISNDLRDLESEAEKGNRVAIEALDAYAYRIRKYIGAYSAILVKVDILIFTGGIGQYGIIMRRRICNRLENLGIVIDYHKNVQNSAQEGVISKDYSRISILVVPTNEEMQIAIDTFNLILGAASEHPEMNRHVLI